MNDLLAKIAPSETRDRPAWLDGRQLDDPTLAVYLAALHDTGRAASAALLAASSPTRAGDLVNKAASPA